MHILRLCFLISLAVLFSACEQQPTQTLKVGISPWPGYEPLAFAAKKGFYEDSTIRIVRFATPTESFRALRDGIIDVAAFTADEVFRYAEVRNQPRIFLIIDISNGADAIVARKEIQSLDDLKGKRLGVEGSALGDYVINRALDFTKEKLSTSDMQFKSVEINEQEQAYLAGEIDAAITYEPSKSLLLKAGAHVLFDSSQIPYEIVDVLVTNEHTIQTRQSDLENLAKGWFRSLAYIKSHYKDTMHEMSLNEDTTVEEFTRGYEDLIIPTKDENLKMLGQDGSLVKPMQRLSKLMYDKGSLQKETDIKPLLDSRVITAVKEQ